jgi:predicted RNase H-like HicB family nuclease
MTSYTALIDGKTGAYGVYFPDLPGCVAMGATIEEAVVNAAESMRDWIDVTVERGGAIPEPRPIEALLADPEVSEDTAAGALLRSVPFVPGGDRRRGEAPQAHPLRLHRIDGAARSAGDGALSRSITY